MHSYLISDVKCAAGVGFHSKAYYGSVPRMRLPSTVVLSLATGVILKARAFTSGPKDLACISTESMLGTTVLACYLSRMFKRHTAAERNAAMRKYWLQTRALGRTRCIRRAVLESLFTGFAVFLVLGLLPDHQQPSSLRTTALICLIMLPIFLLGGYLEGRWRWQDLEKKYPENNLPPWE
jgi:hypothetical protein